MIVLETRSVISKNVKATYITLPSESPHFQICHPLYLSIRECLKNQSFANEYLLVKAVCGHRYALIQGRFHAISESNEYTKDNVFSVMLVFWFPNPFCGN